MTEHDLHLIEIGEKAGAAKAQEIIEAQAAEIERLRNLVYLYVDPFDVTPEDEDFVQSVIDAVLQEQSK
jgi:hypothetical protein